MNSITSIKNQYNCLLQSRSMLRLLKATEITRQECMSSHVCNINTAILTNSRKNILAGRCRELIVK